MIAHDTVIRASDRTTSAQVHDERVILSLESGRYYSLNSVGVRVWELLQSPMTSDQLEQQLLLEYDVEPVALRRDISQLLCELEISELVVVGL